MNGAMNVCGTSIGIKEYSNQRVVTFADIDRVHHRPEGTAGRNFRQNKGSFIENVDFFKITPDEFRTAIDSMDEHHQNNITLITETGYFMLTKSFRDNLAWEVQGMLVSAYFKAGEEKPTLSVEDGCKIVELINKTPDNKLSLVKAVLANAGVKVPVGEKQEIQQSHTTPRGRLEYTKKYADMNGVGDFLKTVSSVITYGTGLCQIQSMVRSRRNRTNVTYYV